jgi:hypothetical protein
MSFRGLYEHQVSVALCVECSDLQFNVCTRRRACALFAAAAVQRFDAEDAQLGMAIKPRHLVCGRMRMRRNEVIAQCSPEACPTDSRTGRDVRGEVGEQCAVVRLLFNGKRVSGLR